ncbi:MAG: hypothetical protein ACRDBL_09070 [Rhabdaerophilum sp.]
MAKTKAETGTETEAPRFVVTITAPSGPRRRAGFAFGKEPVHLTDADLDEEKEKALTADPQLVIRPYREPEPEAKTEA